ncbi:G protein-coupled glucose receptor regulating Gpa2-domain-containing protein [Elsinoe ampelina]|uniref:G protein-coupled glucose receptor regulating Gpa2-domain-containing protein n=1 Tax=Elsinoe ampelina TaxID=302913 RepID=A0A6A6GHP4_9PEZI|nr:G protein-coupled glucose receptor regulating Gpa2-domain-containing protein [Elsinoe ampelina]
MTLYWFARMKRKWRHTLIVTLIIADFLKDINYLSFTAIAFIEKHVVSGSRWCQASGFFHQYLVEVTDFVILSIVVHMSVQILNPNATNGAEGGLEKWKVWIFTAILGLPFIMACVAFSNPYGGYQLVGAFCSLPVRPFWYRLTLSWIPRYIIAITIVVLTVIIRYKVKKYQQKLEDLQKSMPTQGQLEDGIIDEIIEESDDDNETSSQEKQHDSVSMVDEKRPTGAQTEEVPPVPTIPAEHQQFTADDLPRPKRMSYRRRQLPPLNTAVLDATVPRGGSIAPSLAPSSAVFSSPTRTEFGPNPDYRSSMLAESFVLEDPTPPRRRKSITDINPRRSQSVIDYPQLHRRASLAEVPRSGSMSRNASTANIYSDRMSTIHSTGRRSSIWDEIDASLDKKMTNRISIFTITASEAGDLGPTDDAAAPVTYESDNIALSARNSMISAPPAASSSSALGHPNPLGQNRNSRHIRRGSLASAGRGSMIYSAARRAMSVISLRGLGEEEAPDSPGAILRRRHRYIQRQLRYLMFYPVLYLMLWACPFLLHVLQYDDRFAVHPPFAVAVLNIVSMTLFGFVNSVVFCMREKPWTAIEGSDGTLVGSLRTCPVYLFMRGLWWRVRGREEEEMDFVG